MKATIKNISYVKEVETKFGLCYEFRAEYNDRSASFLSKSKEQKTFVVGQENEFTETSREYNGVTYYSIKAIKKQGSSPFARKVQQEQSKYSGFAMSYAKDLVVSGSIEAKQMFPTAQKMLDWMVEQDKKLQNG